MTTHLIVFFSALLFRALSGFQNGSGYSRNGSAFYTFTVLMIGAAVFTDYLLDGLAWYHYTLGVIACIAALGLIWVFAFPIKGKWIHSVETICTGSFTLALLLVDFWPVAFALYPGLVLHKIGVNVMGKKYLWNHNGTNDPSGKTWALHLGSWTINVPRLSFRVRLVLAGLSVAGFVVWIFLT